MPRKKRPINFSTASLDDLNFVLTIKDLQNCDPKQIEGFRDACLVNLRFLANCVLRPNVPKKFPPLKEAVHGAIIDALLKPHPKKHLEDWDNIKQFVVLASRGILKSTLGMALLTQIVLCDPDIRILVMSGKLDKAESILAGARDPFLNNEVLRYLFPEWMIEKSDIRVGDFLLPHRNKALNYRDPTIGTSSFDSVKAGGHFEIILFDDCTNEVNSKTTENCQKTIDQYTDTFPLVEPGGYRIFLGTKWNEDDLPSFIKKESDAELAANAEATAKYFVLPVWALRTDGTPAEIEARNKRETQGKLTEADVILTWPEKLTFKFLAPDYRGSNRHKFYCQYLLDPKIEQKHSFSAEVLDRQFCDRAELKKVAYHDRAVCIFIDPASVFSGRRRASETDYSAGAVGVYEKSSGRLYVVDLFLEHFVSGSDICRGIINLFKTAEMYGPIYSFDIEDANGSTGLGDLLSRIAQETGVDLMPPNWREPDNSSNSKNQHIAILASAMQEGKVFVLNDIPHVDEVREQFVRWTIDAKRRRDDAPDCISLIYRHYKNQIAPNEVSATQSSEFVWMPDSVRPVEGGPVDNHADEAANADIDWLAKDTVLFS